MESVRLHRSGNVVWVLAKCKVCREVGKHLLTDAMKAPIECKHCKHRMDIKGATVEAVEANVATVEDRPELRVQFGEYAAD